MKISIVIVDDDKSILELLAPALKEAGYQTRCFESADPAYAHLQGGSTDLLLLDIGLPGITGLKLLELLKKDGRTASLPVIFLTTRKDERSRVQGLKTGADDYICKPFSVKELVARVEAVLRRVQNQGRTESVVEAAGVRIDFDRREVTADSQNVDLTPVELSLLSVLIRRPGQVFSYQTLSDSLSEGSRIMTSENLYAHVKNLRKKLGRRGKAVETVHGVGYRFARG